MQLALIVRRLAEPINLGLELLRDRVGRIARIRIAPDLEHDSECALFAAGRLIDQPVRHPSRLCTRVDENYGRGARPVYGRICAELI